MDAEILEAIEYDENRVDIESIMQQIREYLARKSGKPLALADGRTDSLRPPEPGAGSRTVLDAEVYDELYHANQTYDKLYVLPYLAPTRVPLLGSLWRRVRAKVHGLVLFYVNRLGETQIRFNSHVVRVLNGMVRDLDEDETPEQVASLHTKVLRLARTVQELDARLATLERQVAPGGTGSESPKEMR